LREQSIVTTRNVKETLAVGEQLGRRLERGDVVALYGELGSGKTTLTKGIARGLRIQAEVFSPTFTLIHEYPGRLPLYHVDLYRIQDEEEIWNLGIEEYLYGEGVTVIEWADRMQSLLPSVRLDVSLRAIGEEEREIEFRAHSERLSRIAEETASGARSRD